MAKKRSKPQNAVLFHHPDAVDTSRSRLMGRHAAGEGFLKGFVRHSGVDDFHCHAFEREHFDDFQRRIGAIDGNNRPCHWVPMGEMAAAESGTLMLSDPSLAPFSWRRRSTGNRGYSLCGLTHTIASNKVMDILGDMLVAPLQPWDALICTSQVVKDTVTEVLDNWGDYLKARTGGKIKPEILLPVIPLGIDCDAYDTGGKGGDERQKIRRQLGIEEDDIVVLFMGRLSFHAKAHPTPMYLSLEEAAKRSGKRLHLIQAGWFANKAIEKEFREGVAAFCPSVNGIFLDGREPDVRFKVWFAADIFTSLSDNVQETFGLSPIEAMAAGLPVVVSDWNGYRDTVRPGIDGFTIPTWLPLPRSGGDLALAPETKINPKASDQAYDQYLGLVSQSTAVDVAQAADAFSALASEADLRRQMGEAGRKRARESFDWRRVVTAYQALWRDLETIRKREKEIVPVTKGKPALPLRDDPFSLYASYPTETLDGDAVVSIPEREESWADRLAAVKAQFMNTFAAIVLLAADEQEAILRKLEEEGPLNVYALAELIPTERRYLLSRTVAWLAKMDIVRLQPAKGKSGGKKGRWTWRPKAVRAGPWSILASPPAARARSAPRRVISGTRWRANRTTRWPSINWVKYWPSPENGMKPKPTSKPPLKKPPITNRRSAIWARSCSWKGITRPPERPWKRPARWRRRMARRNICLAFAAAIGAPTKMRSAIWRIVSNPKVTAPMLSPTWALSRTTSTARIRPNRHLKGPSNWIRETSWQRPR